MKLRKTSNGEYPEDNQYVLGFAGNEPWCDSHDVNGNRFFRVVKFVRGLSRKEREALPNNDDRKYTYRSQDEHGNNERPYSWEEFGPSQFFGQDIDVWFDLNELPKD